MSSFESTLSCGFEAVFTAFAADHDCDEDIRNLNKMLVTHPPVRRMLIGRQRIEIQNSEGIRFSDFVDVMAAAQGGAEVACWVNSGGRTWQVLPQARMGITGYEMLRLLEMNDERDRYIRELQRLKVVRMQAAVVRPPDVRATHRRKWSSSNVSV